MASIMEAETQKVLAEKLIIGTRGSQLALWQANHIKSALEHLHPGLFVELSVIKTKGDIILDVPLAKVGGKGLFVKEIEEALLDCRIDIAVHSMKDMPADIPHGLCIGAVPKRETPADVLISKNGDTFFQLKTGAKIGTSSLRRAAQLLHARSDIEIVPLRGNLDTRLKKLTNGHMDAVVLAAAGVKRLGLEKRITEHLDESIMLPAVGQGALCIEMRDHDPMIGHLVASLDHAGSRNVVRAERAFLKLLEGGCQTPIAAYGKIDSGVLNLTGLVATTDGSILIRETLSGPADKPETIGRELADLLLLKGAKPILDKLRAGIT
ncbi:MAG: hydroxymethylbilane synthase [Desulfobacterales bacterium]